MNQALLFELQRRSAYPSITLLHSTEPGAAMRPVDASRLEDLVTDADRRLRGDVDDATRTSLVDALRRLVYEAAAGPATAAIAVCASPEFEAVVRLGSDVDTRTVVDRTFATRDMVADANRTASFRVVTVSDRTTRLLVGDRDRLVEVQDWHWPLVRADEESGETWRQRINLALTRELTSFDAPTVFAGVTHSINALVDASLLDPIGTVAGNHDRTPASELHASAWPVVGTWLRRDCEDALARLDLARGARVFAGGVDEVWGLAQDGRVELLVVEDDYRLAARTDGDHLAPVDNGDVAGAADDVVDELIEAVLRAGGDTVMVPSGELSDYDRIAAVLRY